MYCKVIDKKAGRLIMVSMNKGVHQRKAGFLVQKPASFDERPYFWLDHDTKGEEAMLREGQVRIPSGCAVSGIIAKDGRRLSGESIIKSISIMHDRSNGLGAASPAMGSIPNIRTITPSTCFTTIRPPRRLVRISSTAILMW